MRREIYPKYFALRATFFVFYLFTTLSYATFAYAVLSKKNDFIRTERIHVRMSDHVARVTAIYCQFWDDSKYFCHMFIIIIFDVFNLDPAHFISNTAPSSSAHVRVIYLYTRCNLRCECVYLIFAIFRSNMKTQTAVVGY